MFAVLRTGGKQYEVAVGDVLEVERLPADVGSVFELSDVLMLGGSDVGDGVSVGSPKLGSATVSVSVQEHSRRDKVLVFKKRRRKNSRRLKGHRQHSTVLRVEAINT